MGLKEYAAKRQFEKTPEPEAGTPRAGQGLVFVMHKHAARALHYDLRLELDGVLKSWAVPKGPSLDPSVKRLAVMVEDHPLDYQHFEGVIPEGNYGAGSVIIWDRGCYRHPLARDENENEQLLRAGLRKGDLKFVLEGEKLQGEFALVKTRQDEKSWLLLKKKDRFAATRDILQANRSVASHKTLEELLEAGASPAFREKKVQQIRWHEALESAELQDAPLAALPHHIRPMLATLVREPFDHPDWLFEVKWDGYRAVAELREGKVALYSRNLLSLNEKFFPIVEALQKFDFAAVLDGEIVVVDDRGQPDFQRLQNYRKTGSGHLLYYVFDLLYWQGHDLTGLPLLRRKELLKKILPASPKIRFSDHIRQDGALFFQATKGKGLEGIIAKQAQSGYEIGRRSRQWLKVKTLQTQEGVIVGFTAPRGGRKHFGTLVLGVYNGDELICIGHAGGGFKAKELEEIHARLEPLIQKECPFKVPPENGMPVTWVRPELVCEVKLLRHVDEEAKYFFRTLSLLEKKAGPPLFQLPGSFRAKPEVLEEFLSLIPENRPCAFEFRSESWFKKEILDLLRAKGHSLCTADSDEKPAGEIISTAPWGYLRLRRSDYTEADLSQWLERILAQPWEQAFVFFKYEDAAKGPELARRFQELADARE
jgi:bifunctional non-homologous end joining protein LigD